MMRWGLTWLLLGVPALLLAACGGAADVAVEEPPAPASTAPAEPPARPSPAQDEPEAASREDPPAGREIPADAPPSPAVDTGEAELAPDEAPPADAGDSARVHEPDEQPVERDGSARTAEVRPAERAGEEDRGADPGAAPAISIERPVAGSEHGAGHVTAEGQATVYEGTVLLTLVGPDGSVVEEAFATATAGAPERGRWSHTFGTAVDAPGRWQVVAAATDPSDGEGHPPARTVTEFHVMGGG